MVTGYEASFYRQFDVLGQDIHDIRDSLRRIASCMEAAEKRAQEEQADKEIDQ